MKVPLWCMVVALACAVARAQEANSKPAETAPPARDLVSVAKAEAVRERAAVEGKVADIITDLRKSSDESLGFIQTRIDDLAKLGAAATDPILKIMDHADADPGSVNAGVNAAKAIAKTRSAELVAKLRDLGEHGGRFGRKNALLALGYCGDASLVPYLKDRLADTETDVKREAIVALGRLGPSEAEPLLVPFLESTDAALVAATIAALAQTDAAHSSADVVARLAKELGAEKPDEALLRAGITFLEKRPVAAGVPLLDQVLRSSNTDPGLRTQSVAALMQIAHKDNTTRKEVLRALRESIKLLPRTPMREAAKGMNELGDDSGVKIVTEDLDRQIEKNGSNVGARYKRAELLLDFGKWKEANRDLKEALKNDKDPADPEWVNLALARSYAGMARFSDASKHIAKLEKTDVAQLPALYPEFQAMANDSRYEKAFQPPPPK